MDERKFIKMDVVTGDIVWIQWVARAQNLVLARADGAGLIAFGVNLRFFGDVIRWLNSQS